MPMQQKEMKIVIECMACGIKGLSRDKQLRLIDLVRFASHGKTFCSGDNSKEYVALGKDTK